MSDEDVSYMILGDCLTKYSEEDIQLLKANFEQTDSIPSGDTFEGTISMQAFNALLNRYRLPDDNRNAQQWNDGYRKESIGLDEFLTIEEIKQISFYDYAGEHIHSVLDYSKSEEGYTYCTAKDVALASHGLTRYLLNTGNQSLRLDRKHADELQRLELLSSIARKYNSEIVFYNY